MILQQMDPPEGDHTLVLDAEFQGDIGRQQFTAFAGGKAGFVMSFDVGSQPPGNVCMKVNLLFIVLIPEVYRCDERLVIPDGGYITYLGVDKKILDPFVSLGVFGSARSV